MINVWVGECPADMFRGNVLQPSGTPPYFQCKANANKSLADWEELKHRLRKASTEIYLNELRSTLSFGIICVQFL